MTGAAPGDALVVLDLLFITEGVFRLIRAAVTGLPVGSVLGLPFISVYERWVNSYGRS